MEDNDHIGARLDRYAIPVSFRIFGMMMRVCTAINGVLSYSGNVVLAKLISLMAGRIIILMPHFTSALMLSFLFYWFACERRGFIGITGASKSVLRDNLLLVGISATAATFDFPICTG